MERIGRVGTGRRSRRLLALLVAGAAAIGVAGIGDAVPAGAATYKVSATGGVGVRQRQAPTVNAGYAGVAPEGAAINLECQQWGEAMGNYGNRLWYRVNRAGTGSWWINDTYTNTPRKAADGPLAGVPTCSAPPVKPSPTPTPAPAAGPLITRAAPMYLCVDTANAGCRPAGMPSVAAGQAVAMVCWMDGSNATGDYTTNRWFWITGPSGEGYVTASVVRNQASVGWCGSRKGFVAAEAAVARNGQTSATVADAALFDPSEWRGGPDREWAGDCPKLPYVAWKAAGITVPKQDAITNYRTWNGQGRIQQGAPPRGAIVFYDVTAKGHTAVSLGGGWVVSTQGTDNTGLPIAVKRYTDWKPYLGWVLPA